MRAAAGADSWHRWRGSQVAAHVATCARPVTREGAMADPTLATPPRGYFGIGAERISKALNLGNLMRSAHGFGASFTFTVGATYQALEARADTSKGALHLPHYNWGSPAELVLPAGCRLVGV